MDKNDIIRQSYLDKIEHSLGKNIIIILTGQRRVGKSSVLRLFKTKQESSEKNNIIYINKEKHSFDSIRTYLDLNEYIDSHLDEDKMNYILIDEVQEIEEFEKSLRSYYEEPKVELVVTGSNSSMLSSELSSKIGGRYKEIYIQALSYEEFLTFHELTDNDESLAKYIQYGGLPGLIRYGLDEQDAREYQTDVYNTVLLKDVVMRNQIRNVVFLENLVHFLADNSGQLISANSIAKYMKSQGESITSTAVINYAKFLCESYMLHKVNRYDIHGKRLFESNDKFYFEDNGIRNALAGGRREGDIEKVIENIIYNHLVRQGYEVMVGQLQAGEIDFVCTKPKGERIYVQASYIIADEATYKREFGNLHAIKDNYPKYVISMTPLVTTADDHGVRHIHLRKFLTESLERL
ncbi:MAG: ATP-binding protein [Paludibacteraceae bacterium]|nr:ATP-binding protein [Paludibacteraceae bacterium]